CPRCTGHQRQHRQFLSHFGPQLPPAGSQSQEKTGLSRFLPEEQTRRIGRKDGASHHRQHKDHHHLFTGIAALGQHRQNGGGTHHTAVSCDQQNRKEAASRQQSITALVFAAQHLVYLRKMPHLFHLIPDSYPGWCPTVCPERPSGHRSPFPESCR